MYCLNSFLTLIWKDPSKYFHRFILKTSLKKWLFPASEQSRRYSAVPSKSCQCHVNSSMIIFWVSRNPSYGWWFSNYENRHTKFMMKLPFHTILGPIFKKNRKNIKTLCSHSALQFAPIYVGILGVLGVVNLFESKNRCSLTKIEIIIFICFTVYYLVQFKTFNILTVALTHLACFFATNLRIKLNK